ncbi:MAG: adenylyltransferase/cytidyltransferase family protein [Thermoleophilia bacterium]
MNIFEHGKIGYFHGRFQPFHIGHMEVVNKALEECQILVIGISNPLRSEPIVGNDIDINAKKALQVGRRVPDNNPWPFWARLVMIREGLKSEGIKLERIIIIPNVNNTGLPVDEISFPKQFVKVYLGAKSAFNVAMAQKYQNEGWNTTTVPLNHKNNGAGEIRRRMINNERWESLVPKGTSEIIMYLKEYDKKLWPVST